MWLIGRKLTSATKRRSGSFQLDEIQDTADEIQDTADEIQDTADEIQDTAVPCPYQLANGTIELRYNFPQVNAVPRPLTRRRCECFD